MPLKENASASKVGMFVQLAGGVSGADGLALGEAALGEMGSLASIDAPQGQ